MKYSRQALQSHAWRAAAAVFIGSFAWGQASEEEARLEQLIAPRDSQEASAAEETKTEFRSMVAELVARNQWDAVVSLGEPAGPVLRSMVEEKPLVDLLVTSKGNLMGILLKAAPLAALDSYDELARLQPQRFEALTRSAYPFTELFDSSYRSRGLGQGAALEKLLGLLDGVLLNPSFTLERRVEVACIGAYRGYLTPTSRTLLRENMELALRLGNTGSLLDVLAPPGEPVPLGAPLSLVKKVVERGYTADLLRQLARSPHANVREYTAHAVGEAIRRALFTEKDGLVAVLERLVDDESSVVRTASGHSALETLDDSQLQLSPKDVTALAIVTLRSGAAERHNAGSLMKALHERWREHPGFARQDVASVVGLIASMESPPVRSVWSQYRIDFGSNIEAAFGAVEGAEGGPTEMYNHVLSGLLDTFGDGRATTAEAADATLELLLRARGDQQLESRIVAELVEQRSPSSPMDRRQPGRVLGMLGSLSPKNVPAAIAWFASTETVLGENAQDSVMNWGTAGGALRTVFGDATRSWKERSIAGGGLLNTGLASPSDRASIALFLASTLEQEGGALRVNKFLDQRTRGVSPSAKRAWSELSAVLLESPAIPDSVASTVPLMVECETPAEVDLVRRVLDAANGRQASSTEPLGFANLSRYGLTAMAARPSLVQKPLLMEWVTRGARLDDSVLRAALASDDAEILQALQGRLESALRAGRNWDEMNRLADLMVMLPGDEPVEFLLAMALQSDEAPFTDHVDQLVAKQMRLRRASIEWGQLGKVASTKEASVARLVKLLESPNKDVRIAAIQGLGTMGAMVAVPDLVELVGSEDESIRAAALDALDRLKERESD